MNLVNLIGLAFLFLFILLLVAAHFVLDKKKKKLLREIEAFRYLRRSIGVSVEDGKRIHLALGWGSLFGEPFGSGLIGLSTLDRFSRVALYGDKSPITTSGTGELMILSQDTLNHSYRGLGKPNINLINEAQMAGVTPFSYAIGTQAIIRDEDVSIDVILGHFNNELGLILDASERQGNLSIGGSDDLTAQAIFYGAGGYPLIGEEVYAAGAYLGNTPMHQASLLVQDYMRWGIIVGIIIGILLKIVGVL